MSYDEYNMLCDELWKSAALYHLTFANEESSIVK